MPTPTGKQIAPEDTQFHDSVTGQWSPLESPNSDRRRLGFPTVANKSYIVVTVVAGVAREFAPMTGVVGMQNNSAKDNVTGFPGFFVYEQ